MGLYDTPVAQYPGGATAREKTNHYVTGRDGGRDIDLRAVRAPRACGSTACSPAAPARALSFRPTLTRGARRRRRGLQLDQPRHRPLHRARRASTRRPARAYEPVWAPPEPSPTSLDLAAAGITTIVWAIGYRPDYRWVEVGVFDGAGPPDPHPRRHRRARPLLPRAAVAAHLGLGPVPRHRARRRARGRDASPARRVGAVAVAGREACGSARSRPTSGATSTGPLAKVEGIVDDARARRRRPAGAARRDPRRLPLRPAPPRPASPAARAGRGLVRVAPGRRAGGRRWSSASATPRQRRATVAATTRRSACTGDGVLGRHRKVHQPAGESLVYARRRPRSRRSTPRVGRIGHAHRLRQDVPRGGPLAGRWTAPRCSPACRRGRPPSPTARRGCRRTGSRGCSTSTTAPGPRRTRSSGSPRTRPA